MFVKIILSEGSVGHVESVPLAAGYKEPNLLIEARPDGVAGFLMTIEADNPDAALKEPALHGYYLIADSAGRLKLEKYDL